MKAIILARVSTEEQKDAGNSLPAQTRRMEDYCTNRSFEVIERYSFDESAYKQKRDEFDKLLEKIDDQKEKTAVCFDKVDRLSRNVFDKRVAELYEKAINNEIELHFVSDGQVINSSMSAVEKFQFGMSLGLAKYYSDAISDNTKRAFEQKRLKGEWTGSVPFGYVGVALNTKKRLRADIIPDPLNSLHVQELFKLYATGRHSVSTLKSYLDNNGVKTVRGYIVGTSTVHNILKNTFYYGKAYSRKYDKHYDHRYTPLITKELFDTVQTLLAANNQNPVQKKSKGTTAFKGLLKCSICGCSVCREVKRGKAYHACSNGKKMHKREYIKETKLIEQVSPLFQNLILTDDQIEQIVSFLRENHEYKAKYYQEQTTALSKQFDQLQEHKDKLLDLLLEGAVTQPDYETKLEQLNTKQQLINVDRGSYTEADYKYHVTAKYILELAKRAGELFERSNDEEKNQLLKLVLSNVTFDGKKLDFTIRKPFDTIMKVEGSPVLLPELEAFRTVEWRSIDLDLKVFIPDMLSLPS
jgi:site-specific DNA recombinase